MEVGTYTTQTCLSRETTALLNLPNPPLAVGLLAGIFSFRGVAGTSTSLAKLAFFILLVLAVLAFSV